MSHQRSAKIVRINHECNMAYNGLEFKGMTAKERTQYVKYLIFLPDDTLILSKRGQLKYGDIRWARDKKGVYNKIDSSLYN
jgi:hypothetical protein